MQGPWPLHKIDQYVAFCLISLKQGRYRSGPLKCFTPYVPACDVTQKGMHIAGAVQLVTGHVAIEGWGVLHSSAQTTPVLTAALWTVLAVLKYTRLIGDYPAEALSWAQTVHKLHSAGG